MPAATMSRSDEKSARKSNPQKADPQKSGARPEPRILYQTYFKSVGTRTYAAQVKEASNGNHFITLTSGLENLTAFGKAVLWKGAQKIRFEEV